MLSAKPSADRNGLMEISVMDTGSGIPPEEVPRLFERFYQVDKSRGETKRGSAGLGLSIVKELTEAHGGKVDVESVVGLGSRFVVRLPAAPEVTAEGWNARNHR